MNARSKWCAPERNSPDECFTERRGMVCLALPFMPKPDFTKYPERKSAAYIKHCLLQEYLPNWAYKVGHAWDSLVYVDGFAGPWETTDPNHSDSSFAIAIDSLQECQTGLSNK